MKIAIFAALAALALATPATAGPAEDATAAIAKVLDQFNAGDFDAFVKAHAPNAIIIDEFAPYQWTGDDVAARWGGDYEKDAKARGISGGHMDHGAPIQANSDGASAYIVLPTAYHFVRNGTKMVGKGSMTFVMTKAGADWQIASWTYSGATPVAE
jgi:hypothetical protein